LTKQAPSAIIKTLQKKGNKKMSYTNWNDPPKCSTCAHLGDLTLEDVAACNCCENYNFYEPREEK
jgi:hypothetical protein